MFWSIILILVSLILWIISIIFNDIEDGLQYYYPVSIFDWLPKDGWWSWYMQDPDDTWKRRYYWDENGNKIGRKFWPAFIYDGWHGAKIIRQFFQYLTWLVGVFTGVVLTITLTFSQWVVFFFATLVLFAVTNHLTHEEYVFKGVIKKEWWIKREKEEQIKKFLDKHF